MWVRWNSLSAELSFFIAERASSGVLAQARQFICRRPNAAGNTTTESGEQSEFLDLHRLYRSSPGLAGSSGLSLLWLSAEIAALVARPVRRAGLRRPPRACIAGLRGSNAKMNRFQRLFIPLQRTYTVARQRSQPHDDHLRRCRG